MLYQWERSGVFEPEFQREFGRLEKGKFEMKFCGWKTLRIWRLSSHRFTRLKQASFFFLIYSKNKTSGTYGGLLSWGILYCVTLKIRNGGWKEKTTTCWKLPWHRTHSTFNKTLKQRDESLWASNAHWTTPRKVCEYEKSNAHANKRSRSLSFQNLLYLIQMGSDEWNNSHLKERIWSGLENYGVTLELNY